MATNNGLNGHRPATPLPVVRQTVRDLLLASPAYGELSPDERLKLASLMVRVCDTAARLVQEDMESSAEVQALLAEQRTADQEAAAAPAPIHGTELPTAQSQGVTPPTRLARAQTAGREFSGVAAQRIAGTTRAILNAVSFPAFVSDLINGVFKAITDTSLRQMQSYIELLNNVSASTQGFADLNYAPDRARQWLVDQFPGAYMLEGGDEEDEGLGGDGWGDGGWGGSDGAGTEERRVVLRPGAERPSDEALRTALGLDENASLPSGDPDRALIPLVRQRLARTRQETLATLIQLGMQRIVIEGGRINAAMRFHIDTRSAAQADEGSTFDTRTTMGGSGKFGLGPWGVSASMQQTIGYVSTSRTQTTEEMNVDLDLNSSVELIFRTDQVPLNRLASADQTARILANTRNPEAETRLYTAERQARRQAQEQADASRRQSLTGILTPRPASPSTPAPAPTTSRQPSASRSTSPSGSSPATATPTRSGSTPAPATAAPATGGSTPAPSGGTPASSARTPAPATRPPASGARPASP